MSASSLKQGLLGKSVTVMITLMIALLDLGSLRDQDLRSLRDCCLRLLQLLLPTEPAAQTTMPSLTQPQKLMISAK
jgi:hypothetical protein